MIETVKALYISEGDRAGDRASFGGVVFVCHGDEWQPYHHCCDATYDAPYGPGGVVIRCQSGHDDNKPSHAAIVTDGGDLKTLRWWDGGHRVDDATWD